MRMGAMASVDAAESFAQNRPCGLENEAMKAVSGAALVVVRRIVQKASFQARMMLSRHLTKRNSRKPLIHFWIVYHQRKEAFLSADTGTQIAFQKLLSDTI